MAAQRDSDDEDEDIVSTCNCEYLKEGDVKSYMLNRIACSTNPVDLFRVLHVNSRSLQKNYGELLNLIHIAETNFDIVAVTETWLTDQNDQLYQIPGYNFVNIHRTGKVGGGVGIYIESSYSYKVLV
jgi:hypothetical protein